MRLTNQMRARIVDMIMWDIPKIDYNDQIERLVREAAINELPEPIKQCVEVHPEYIKDGFSYVPGFGTVCTKNVRFELKDARLKEIQPIVKAYRDHKGSLQGIRTELVALFDSSNTVEQALKRTPEFKKYINKVADSKLVVNKDLPAVTGLMDRLSNLGLNFEGDNDG